MDRWRDGKMEHGIMETWKHRNMETWKHRNMEIDIDIDNTDSLYIPTESARKILI